MVLKLIGMIGEEHIEKVLPEELQVYLGRTWRDDRIKRGFFIPDNHVSGIHCVINSYNQNQYTVTDLGSTNGTFINGLEISDETGLKNGDTLSLSRKFKFEVRIE